MALLEADTTTDSLFPDLSCKFAGTITGNRFRICSTSFVKGIRPYISGTVTAISSEHRTLAVRTVPAVRELLIIAIIGVAGLYSAVLGVLHADTWQLLPLSFLSAVLLGKLVMYRIWKARVISVLEELIATANGRHLETLRATLGK